MRSGPTRRTRATPQIVETKEPGEDAIDLLPAETPSGPPGSVTVVEFTLGGQSFLAISAGPLDAFNHAVSFVVAKRVTEAMLKRVKLDVAQARVGGAASYHIGARRRWL